MERYFIPAVVTFWIAIIITPIVKMIALKLKMVDSPDNRKVHKEPIPLLGGLAIFSSFVISLLVFYKSVTALSLKGVVLGGLFIFILGLVDDKYGMRWRIKLLGQILIAAMVVFGFDIISTVFNNDLFNAALL